MTAPSPAPPHVDIAHEWSKLFTNGATMIQALHGLYELGFQRGSARSDSGLKLPERENLPCSCCEPPNYDGCDCGNSGDTMSQGFARGWNACIDKMEGK